MKISNGQTVGNFDWAVHYSQKLNKEILIVTQKTRHNAINNVWVRVSDK